MYETLMIAKHETRIDFYGASERWIGITVKTMRYILSFSSEPILKLTCQKTGINLPNVLF